MIDFDQVTQVKLRDLTSVIFPPEDQSAIFNRELRIGIHNARTLGENKILEGAWLGLHAVGAISDWHYSNLIAAYCNTRDKGGWADMDDEAIIKHCGGTLS